MNLGGFAQNAVSIHDTFRGSKAFKQLKLHTV